MKDVVELWTTLQSWERLCLTFIALSIVGGIAAGVVAAVRVVTLQ